MAKKPMNAFLPYWERYLLSQKYCPEVGILSGITSISITQKY